MFPPLTLFLCYVSVKPLLKKEEQKVFDLLGSLLRMTYNPSLGILPVNIVLYADGVITQQCAAQQALHRVASMYLKHFTLVQW